MSSKETWSDEYLYELIKKKPKSGIGSFSKENPTDKVWWVDSSDREGLYLFSFDCETVYNLWTDYPYKLTPEQKKIFDEENPYWAEFFKGRTQTD